MYFPRSLIFDEERAKSMFFSVIVKRSGVLAQIIKSPVEAVRGVIHPSHPAADHSVGGITRESDGVIKKGPPPRISAVCAPCETEKIARGGRAYGCFTMLHRWGGARSMPNKQREEREQPLRCHMWIRRVRTGRPIRLSMSLSRRRTRVPIHAGTAHGKESKRLIRPRTRRGSVRR